MDVFSIPAGAIRSGLLLEARPHNSYSNNDTHHRKGNNNSYIIQRQQIELQYWDVKTTRVGLTSTTTDVTSKAGNKLQRRKNNNNIDKYKTNKNNIGLDS